MSGAACRADAGAVLLAAGDGWRCRGPSRACRFLILVRGVAGGRVGGSVGPSGIGGRSRSVRALLADLVAALGQGVDDGFLGERVDVAERGLVECRGAQCVTEGTLRDIDVRPP